jgi:FAD/FMN-containing dehydrogenase
MKVEAAGRPRSVKKRKKVPRLGNSLGECVSGHPVHRLSRRAVLHGALAIGASVALPDRARGEIVLDDASHLNATPAAVHAVVKSRDKRALVDRLRRELKDASIAGRPVAMGVARHSMGGQSLARNGTVFTFETPVCEPDRDARIYRAHAGTRWRDVIATLDPLAFSPKVMQSNNDFGVASTFSVNAHGWPVPYGPFGSTVRALRLMLASGEIVTCSRSENTELFRHVMGGYGLFGMILDLDVEMVPNALLTPTFEALSGTAFGARFPSVCSDPSVMMAYGRLDVSLNRFLEGALLISFRPLPAPAGNLPPAKNGEGIVSFLAREIYRAQIGSDWAKRFRWRMESGLGPRLDLSGVTRNSLLNYGSVTLAERNPRRTDILHEYFVPPASLSAFLASCRELIPRSKQELLNVTLRFIASDPESILSYAPRPRISAVMSFSQARTAEADASMQQLTRDLVERVLAVDGSFYLPYRLHARSDQIARAYPAVGDFVACKRRYDPGFLFRNALWDTWFEELARKTQ